MKTLLTIVIIALAGFLGVLAYKNQSSIGQNTANVNDAVQRVEQGEKIGIATAIKQSTLVKQTTNGFFTGLEAKFTTKVIALTKAGLKLPIRAHIDLVMTGSTTPLVISSQTVTGVIVAGPKGNGTDIAYNKNLNVEFRTVFATSSIPYPGMPYQAVLRKIEVVSPKGVIVLRPISTDTVKAGEVVVTPRTTSVNLSKLSSTVTTTKYNNRDTGVVSTIRLNLTAVKGDVSAISGLTAEISLKNIATGEVIATKTVNGVPESGLQVFSEGAIKEVSFTSLFSASSPLPIGVTNISSVVNKITYKPISTGVVQTVTSGMSQFNSEGYTTFTQ